MKIKGLFSRNKKGSNPAAKITRRNYLAAAKQDRLTQGWFGIGASADEVVRSSLTVTRRRARQMAADNDYMRRFFKLCRSNVVGSQGIRMQVRAISSYGKDEVVFDDQANRIIEEKWYEWAKKRNCTIDRRQSLIDVKQLIIETTARDGEIFVRKIRGKAARNEFGFALQLIEADHVNENMNEDLPGGNKIRMGIEYDKWNVPIAYHIATSHPGDNLALYSGSNSYERVPANEIVHLFAAERVSQSRGLPWILSAMRRMKMLAVYEENEVVAAGVGAAKMGFFTSPDGEGYKGDDEDEKGNLIMEAEAGMFEQLPAGVQFQSWDPQHPSTAFPAFVKAMLRGGASGLGVSYVSLANDLEGVNFSSIRQGVLEERELWKLLQTWMIEHFLEEIFEDWLLMGLTTQKIPLPLTKFEKFNKPVWRPRGWGWVDPLKEVKSNIEAVNAGFISAQDVASEQGQDIEDIYAQLSLEEKLRKKHGVTLANPDMQATDLLLAGDNNGTQG